MAFIKFATSKNAILPINKSYYGNIKLASQWADINSFPERYKKLFANYITANSIRVGEYNPEFKYFRVIALHGDIPNENSDLFRWGSINDPEEPELLRIDKSLEKPIYSTFIGRGNYKNHDNNDVSKAVGIILDVAPNQEGKFIEALLAVDTKKDPELIRGIDNGYIDSVSMGCFKAGTLISLPDGEKIPIEKLSIGQNILTHLGNDEKVKNLQIKEYNDLIYKISIMGISQDIEITKEHPVWTITKEQFKCRKSNHTKCVPQDYTRSSCKYRKLNGKFSGKECDLINKEYEFKFIKAENLKKGDFVAYPFSQEIDNSNYATKEFARLLGYYLSEGFCLKSKKGELAGLNFTFGINEKEYINETISLLNKFKTNNNTVNTYNRRDNITNISIYDKLLAQQIKSLCSEYAKYKKLDQSILLWDPEIQLELIGSFINGDGCCVNTEYHNGSIYLSTASKILAEQLFIILLRNNIVSLIEISERDRFRFLNGHRIKDGIQYQINIGNYYNDILSKVSSKISKDKKISTITRRRFIYKNYLIMPITKIKKEKYNGLVYNFEVENDNSYVAGGISVHNCLVQYSICSCCDNIAYNENQYCLHVKAQKGQTILHNGEYKKVYEDNRGVNFIELSWVTVPADPGAKLLEKVAHNKDIFKYALENLNEKQLLQFVSYVYGFSENKYSNEELQHLINIVNDIKNN